MISPICLLREMRYRCFSISNLKESILLYLLSSQLPGPHSNPAPVFQSHSLCPKVFSIEEFLD